ncbi:amino acid ABC transporter ATP-binding protein [Leucobacter sp. OH1287]|uniref:amino acid ABC transporter ATP-binding protein n=1 Tax=Leucobacter sp. OH1287 TaxID=2491049 RepID=UPI000F5FDD64|nr:amino acid ABC transporter ATP-binding protein [Leucobacter sp. OH1287]RRD61193.1 amino acid ABC transporter ATP-binding protein [Leucobacter sp. OH1287]
MSEERNPNEEVVLSISDFRKEYGGHAALDGVSLSVKRGEVVAIIGPSGSGKSTLLRSINQLEIPDSGQLTVLGENIDFSKRVSTEQLLKLRRKVGMVFQSFNLFPHMNVLRNVSFPQERVLGRSREEADKVSRSLLERVGLAAKVDTYPQRCSGGQQQRVAIARALALEPEIMLFDEPTSALDPELGLEVLAVMRKLADAGMTMIVVTHEIHFAAEVADRLVVMADGKILEAGLPTEVLAEPKNPRTKKFLSAITDR